MPIARARDRIIRMPPRTVLVVCAALLVAGMRLATPASAAMITALTDADVDTVAIDSATKASLLAAVRPAPPVTAMERPS